MDSYPNDNPQTPRPQRHPEDDQINTPLESTLLVVRPGDALFVMPPPGEVWQQVLVDRMRAMIERRLPEARIIVLPYAATFATVAVEDAHQP